VLDPYRIAVHVDPGLDKRRSRGAHRLWLLRQLADPLDLGRLLLGHTFEAVDTNKTFRRAAARALDAAASFADAI
jgi:hypothetical protein